MRKIIILTAVLAVFGIERASAQKFSVSTDLLGYACLGTFNAEVSYSVSRYWSVTAGARYNPFTFRKGNPTASFSIGSSHIRSVPACGRGIHCPDGGLLGNCDIRNLIPGVSFPAARKKGTGSEPGCMPVIRTCYQGISI